MSMITGCPACGTMFRVVPDQLRISEGWVRCGHCGEVFDATAHLQAEGALDAAAAPAMAAAPPQVVPEPAEPMPPQPAASAAARHQGAPTLEPAHAPRPPAATAVPTSTPAAAEPATPAAAPQSPANVQQAQTEIEEEGYLPVGALRRESEVSVPSSRLHDDAAADDDELPDPGEALDDVTFLREARRKAFWRRPLVRVALVLLAIALTALLALQVAVQERDRLAASRPALRPWLERMCLAFDCQVRAPRRIDAIAIDSSGFIRVGGTHYRLAFTLKNQAQHPVAVPALELTLTDSGDQPVVRRVFLPRELGAQSDTLEGSAEWSGSVGVALEGGIAGERIAGYRLLAFYP